VDSRSFVAKQRVADAEHERSIFKPWIHVHVAEIDSGMFAYYAYA
jgi:hemerythrin